MFSTERDQLRKKFFDAWQKHCQRMPMEPLEAQIADVILQHPEYHALLENPERYQAHDFGDANPFLHMSLHLAIREQISTNRPAGIAAIYQRLCVTGQETQRVEHRMMECLATLLWHAQQNRAMPDELEYLEALQRL